MINTIIKENYLTKVSTCIDVVMQKMDALDLLQLIHIGVVSGLGIKSYLLQNHQIPHICQPGLPNRNFENQGFSNENQ